MYDGFTTKILNSEDDSEIILDYDLLGSLKSFDYADIEIDYAVDPLGKRIAKYKNESFIEGYIYKDQLNPAARVSSSGAVEQLFIYGIKSHVPEYMSYNGNNYKFITDERGSVRMIVNSNTGEVVQEMSYDAFGQVLSDTNPGFQPFGFAGGLYDPDTNLVRFGARDYNPTTGRWMQKDPIGFNGGDTNLYRYVNNDPVNFIDPAGYEAFIVRVGAHFFVVINNGEQSYFIEQGPVNVYLGAFSLLSSGLIDVDGKVRIKKISRKVADYLVNNYNIIYRSGSDDGDIGSVKRAKQLEREYEKYERDYNAFGFDSYSKNQNCYGFSRDVVGGY